MTDTKIFSATVIGSVTSGILLIDDFGKVHEAIEWLAGHPVWTHEIPAVCQKLAPKLLDKYHDLPLKGGVCDWRECAKYLDTRYPDGIELEKGSGERTKDPIQTLVDAKQQGKNVAP